MFSLDWHICRILNDEGEPLTGRITIYNHNTLDKAALKSLEDGEYVDATNPYYIVDGVVTHSLFLADGLYDVVPEEYVGDAVDMTNDDEQSSWVAQRNWSVGIEVKISSTEDVIQTNVYTVAALESVDPNVYNSVCVIGYWTNNDCEPRTYMWDATSTDTIDHGIVFGSGVSETGRWILVEDERILSTYYGLPYANTYTQQLFTYPSNIGTSQKLTPKKIVLLPGTYGDGSTDLISNGKIIEFMPSAKLKEGTNRLCCEQVIAGDYTIGDVTIYYNSPAKGEVKSIWYYSLAGLASSNAKKIVVNGVYSNIHKTNNYIKFSDKIFELQTDFVSPNDDEHPNGYFIFENCKFEGPGCLLMRTNDRFIGCIIDDSLFANHYINNYKDMFSACSAGNDWSSIESKLNGYYSMGYSAVDCYDMVEKNPINISMTDLTGSFTIRGIKTDKRMILSFNSLTLEDCESPDARITTYKNCKIHDCTFSGYVQQVLTATGSQKFTVDCTGNNISGYWRLSRNTSATRNCKVTATIHDNTFDSPELSFFLADSPSMAYTAIPNNKDFVTAENVNFYNNKHLSNSDYGYGKFTSGDWASAGVTALSGSDTVYGMNFTMLQTGHNTKDYSLEIADWNGLAKYGMDYYIPFGYIGNNSRWWANYRPARAGGTNDAIISYDSQWLYLTGGFVTGTPGQYQLQNFTHLVKKGK